MGTRSITRVFQGDQAVVIIYRQHDGYPEGHGLDLAGFLKGRRLVDGLAPGDDDGAEVSNGMGCLAASLICALKTGPGGIYLTSNSDEQEEYEYDIRANGAAFSLRVRKWGEKVFDGNLARFAAFCANPERE